MQEALMRQLKQRMKCVLNYGRQPLVRAALAAPNSRVRAKLAFLNPQVLQDRRIEVGSGAYPHDGYLHVDCDPRLRRVDLIAEVEDLPFATGWARELLAVHVLEHVPPQRLKPTLKNWHRILAPGGALEVHVPNGLVLAERLIAEPDMDSYWQVMNGIFGYGAGPDLVDPDLMPEMPDHKVLFTERSLSELLIHAGFTSVEQRRSGGACRHQIGWMGAIPGLCLEITAVA